MQRTKETLVETRRFRTRNRSEMYCHRCGKEEAIEIHHILPIQDGGDESEENLIPLCHICHEEVGAWNDLFLPEEVQDKDWYNREFGKFMKTVPLRLMYNFINKLIDDGSAEKITLKQFVENVDSIMKMNLEMKKSKFDDLYRIQESKWVKNDDGYYCRKCGAKKPEIGMSKFCGGCGSKMFEKMELW